MSGIPAILLQCVQAIDSEHIKLAVILYGYSLLMTKCETAADALEYFHALLQSDDLAEIERAANILSHLLPFLNMMDMTIEDSKHLFEAVFQPSDSHQ
jgi:hypothetical protein